MSVYGGIDVHGKRSQLAVIDAGGEVLTNRNVPDGVEPILEVIGGLPPGTPAAFEAAFGAGWLVELLEGHGFEPHLVQGDRLGQVEERQGPARRSWRSCCARDLLPEAWIAARGAPAAGAAAAPGAAGPAADAAAQPDHAVLADHGHDRPSGVWSGPGRDCLASLELPAVSREVVEDGLALIGAVQVRIDRLDWEVHQRARGDPRVQG